jgi:hypothetical protein
LGDKYEADSGLAISLMSKPSSSKLTIKKDTLRQLGIRSNVRTGVAQTDPPITRLVILCHRPTLPPHCPLSIPPTGIRCV